MNETLRHVARHYKKMAIATAVRFAGTVVLLVFVYRETGWATTVTLALVALAFEGHGLVINIAIDAVSAALSGVERQNKNGGAR